MTENTADFASPAYWNAGHGLASQTNWYVAYKAMATALRQHLGGHCAAAVLHIGCGLSALAEDMRLDGLSEHHTAFDFAEACVASQPRRHGRLVMDAGRLALRYECVDCVIDKATLDAMLCYDDDISSDDEQNERPIVVTAMRDEILRVLRDGGLYLLLSCHEPATVLAYLQEAEDAGEALLLTACVVILEGGLPERSDGPREGSDGQVRTSYLYCCKLFKSSDDNGHVETAGRAHVGTKALRRGWTALVHAGAGDLLGATRADCLRAGEAVATDDRRGELYDRCWLLPAPVSAPASVPTSEPTAAVVKDPLLDLDGARGGLFPPACVLQMQRLGLCALPVQLWSGQCPLDMSRLRVLDCRSNLLASLPEELGSRRTPALEAVHADHNRLEWLPPSLAELTRLVALTATDNLLTELWLGTWLAPLRQCSMLRTLRLRHNPLATGEKAGEEIAALRSALGLRLRADL